MMMMVILNTDWRVNHRQLKKENPECNEYFRSINCKNLNKILLLKWKLLIAHWKLSSGV